VFPTADGGWRDVIYKGPDDIYYIETSTASTPSPPGVGGTFASPLFGSAALPLNAWSHLAATYTGPPACERRPGCEARALLTPIETSTGALTIGGDALHGQCFAGRIDEVRIYNTALRASQIQADINTPVGERP
jgi:Concanavalin A-like lectin/glucanases superfamily